MSTVAETIEQRDDTAPSEVRALVEHLALTAPSAGAGGGRAAVLAAFADVAAAMTKGQNLDTLLGLVTARLCSLTAVRRCTVFLREPDGDAFHGMAGHTEHGNLNSTVRHLIAGTEADQFTREIVRTGEPVFIADTRRDRRPVRSVMRRYGVRSILGIPLISQGTVSGILYLDNEDQPHTFDANTRAIALAFADLASLAITQTQATTELRRSLVTIARQNEVLRRATALDEQLHKAALSGASMQAVAAAMAGQSGKPCAIYDRTLRCRASATPDDGPAPPMRLFDEDLRGHTAIRNALEDLEATGRDAAILGPYRDAGLGHRYLVAPVREDDQCVGYVVVMEFTARLGALDSHIARRVAGHVSIEFAAERRDAATKRDGLATIARELAHGAGAAGPLRRRADYLGIDLDADYAICVVATPAGSEAGLPSSRDLSAALASAAGVTDVLTTTVAEGVVAVMPVAAEDDPRGRTPIDTLKRTMRLGLGELGGHAERFVALSTPCHGASDFRRGLDEALEVLRCQQLMSGPESERLLAASDLGPGRMFLAAVGREEAERFADDALGPISHEPGQLEHLRTLGAFFASGNSIRRAAILLDVHENTVRYRLTKIQDDTGLHVVGNAEDQLTAQMALLIRRLQGVLDTSR
ncbi:MAG: GAF domain-containing protein [Patulibacter sp.]|nr:GAF domain-containing protein [Patulibacter sp.]